MNSGIMPIEVLINYAKSHDPIGDSLRGNSNAGRVYGKLAKELSSQITDDSGIYLWGKYDENGVWNHIYVGKACKSKKAHLRARILEELKDEKHFLWRSVYTEKELLAKGELHYPDMWFRYKNHWALALLKTGTTHIIWVAAPELSDNQINDIELNLIEALNPTANKKRPASFSAQDKFTIEAISHFQQLIEQHRPPAIK
jgi:hypothetical protein